MAVSVSPQPGEQHTSMMYDGGGGVGTALSPGGGLGGKIMADSEKEGGREPLDMTGMSAGNMTSHRLAAFFRVPTVAACLAVRRWPSRHGRQRPAAVRGPAQSTHEAARRAEPPGAYFARFMATVAFDAAS